MAKVLYRVPESVVQNLRVTTAEGGFGPDHLIGAAVWAFSRQDEGLKDLLVREFWYRGLGDEPRHPGPRKSLKEKLYGLVARIRSGFR
jgi:hypothetical protein